MAAGRKVRFEAKTVEAAIVEAEQKLGRKREELEIEVVSYETKGILGIGAHNAVILADVQEIEQDQPVSGEKEPPVEEEKIPVDGSIQVRDGLVTVLDPVNGGMKPTLVPGQYAQVIINGESVSHPREVSSEDDIVLIPNRFDPEWEPALWVTDDNLQAFLTIKRTRGEVYEIRDAGPGRELIVAAKLIKTLDHEVSLKEIQEYLQRNKVVFGLDLAKLEEALQINETREFLVAEGKAAVPPVDAIVRVVFAEKLAEQQENEKTERVGLHEVISVESGELLVEIVLPRLGKPGTDVYGKTIHPGEPKDLVLTAGPGVELDEEQRCAYAVISGRPEVLGTRVTVYPTYTVSGDVVAKTGKIVFKGDINVLGNVLDEMSIEATGQVVVNGYAANASIIAGGNITIHKNIVGGTIRAGGLATVCSKFLNVVQEAQSLFPQLLTASEQLRKHPSFMQNRDIERIGEGIILKMLLENKFQDIPGKLLGVQDDLEILINSLDYRELKSFGEVYEELAHKLSGKGPLNFKTLKQAKTLFDEFADQMEQVRGILTVKAADKTCLTTTYVQNSHLECSGDIKITGKGCYSSDIYAGNNVEIQGMPGVFRGGEIVCSGNIMVRELGSPAEVITEVKINKAKKLKADKVYPGVVIVAGARIERITEEQHNFILTGE